MQRLATIGLALMTAACAGRAGVPTATAVFSSGAGARATLAVTIADTPAERQRGLSGVASLPAGQGMAFLYAQPSTDEFWMKDTRIPLSVAFVRPDGIVVAIREMTPCTAEPCPTYTSPGPYSLAIEAAPSWYRTNNIGIGASAVMGGPPR